MDIVIYLSQPESLENLKKITRLNFQASVFLLAKNQHYIIIAFYMLKIEFKLENTGLTKKG